MLWWLFSGFFGWLALREIYHRFVPRTGFDRPNAKISMPFLVSTVALSAAFAYTPIRYFYFERFLTHTAKILSESNRATVHCNTFVDSMFDSNMLAAGHANIETGRIVLQHPWCGDLMDYVRHPEKATPAGIHSVHLFTHETMHIRGERNEANTDCQAIQRYHRAAKLLGVADSIAKQHGMAYYLGQYMQRGARGPMSSQYYSEQCAPGKTLDEKLPDSTWE
jgi:hypothetical protein